MKGSRVLFAGLLIGMVSISIAIGVVRHVRDDKTLRTKLEPGPVDIGFAQSMGVHHQQAIGMAQMLLDGRPTPLAGLARSIAYAQLEELGEMHGWLRLWERPWLPAAQGMDWMLMGDAPPDAALQKYLLDCRRSPTGMTGMATDAELGQLRALEGRARDELFLRLMLQHHQGGIPMAQFAARNARLGAVRTLAANMVVEQSEEVARILMTLNAAGVQLPR